MQFAAKLGIDLTSQQPGTVHQGQAQQPPQAQQGEQPSVLPQVLQSLPSQILQQLAQMQPQQLAQALVQIEQQLPPQIQQQIAAEVQDIPPDQLLQGIHDMIVQLLQSQGSGDQSEQGLDPQKIQQVQPNQQPPSNQPQTPYQIRQNIISSMSGEQL